MKLIYSSVYVALSISLFATNIYSYSYIYCHIATATVASMVHWLSFMLTLQCNLQRFSYMLL